MSRSVLLTTAALILLAGCRAPERAQAPAPAAAPGPAARMAPMLSPAQIEHGVPVAAPAETAAPPRAVGDAPAPVAPDPGLVRIQVLLDRSAFSPGMIDGLGGENTRQAIEAFREANHLGGGDQADQALLDSLTAADAAPVTAEYVLTAADVAGPFSPPPVQDLTALAAAGTNFSSPLERLAERFHITEALLQGLNPGVDFARAGQRLVVPAVNDAPLAQVARIVVDKGEKAVRAYDAAGRLLAFYPATIGSSDRPAPSGVLTVKGVANTPDYTYDPSRLTYGPGGGKVVVPAGPNNPVGTVWIDLSRDTYGIHGSPDPSKIGKTASHGCVRLTNWDVEQLAAAVKPGVVVRFV